jgi:tetratricopeptide (TPR) repeat protein
MLSILLGCPPEIQRVALQKEPALTPLQEEQNNAGGNPWEALQRAQKLFQQGDFEGAATENQKVLDWAGDHSPVDRALFNMGLIYAHGANPNRDPRRSMAYFRRVAEEFPQNPLAEESKAWISLLQKSLDLTKDVVDLTQENVVLIQEKEALAKEKERLIQENIRLSRVAERYKILEETALSARDDLHRARIFFEQGNFDAALEENQRTLSVSGKSALKDRALFQIGLIYASSRNPKRDLEKSLSHFLRLVKEYPQSALAEEAKTWIDLLQENHKLNRMIERSKEVDIAIEEKKREKGR